MKKMILLISFIVGGSAGAHTFAAKEIYGGRAAQVTVFEDFSAHIDFECATGEVQAGRWPTGQSRIAATGLFTPTLVGRSQKATYKANIDVSRGLMTLAVKVGNKRAVNYQLVRDQISEMKRCR